jgi:16S rRNA U516 pseudouridylate synthase RsuA-like enzyme
MDPPDIQLDIEIKMPAKTKGILLATNQRQAQHRILTPEKGHELRLIHVKIAYYKERKQSHIYF